MGWTRRCARHCRPTFVRRRAPGGEWATVATSEFELSCCMAVGDAIYVGTDDARMLRLSDGSSVLDPIDGFDNVAGRDTGLPVRRLLNGQRVGPPLGIRSVAANSNGTILFANVHVGGIPRSMDGGRTWQPTIDINSDVHEVARTRQIRTLSPRRPRSVFASAATPEQRGPSNERASAHHLAPQSRSQAMPFSSPREPIPLQPRENFIVGRSRPDGAHNGCRRWHAGVDRWYRLQRLFFFFWSTIVAIDRAGTLYLSTDFGCAWSRGNTELPDPELRPNLLTKTEEVGGPAHRKVRNSRGCPVQALLGRHFVPEPAGSVRRFRPLCQEVVPALFGGGEQLGKLRRASQVCEHGIILQAGVGAVVSCDRTLEQPKRDIFLSAEGKFICNPEPVLGVRVRQSFRRKLLGDLVHIRGRRVDETGSDHPVAGRSFSFSDCSRAFAKSPV